MISFVDAATLRPRGSVKVGEGWVGAAAWPSPRRLVAVVGSEGYSRVVTVDPSTRKQLVERYRTAVTDGREETIDTPAA